MNTLVTNAGIQWIQQGTKNEPTTWGTALWKGAAYLGSLLGLILALMVPAQSVMAQPTFTGDAQTDFAIMGAAFVADPTGIDVGIPPPNPPATNFPPGTVSGWDVRGVYFYYDQVNDKLYVGVDCYGVCGDADGDGDPGNTTVPLMERGGQDLPNLQNQEAIVIAIDTNNDYTGPGDFPPANFEVVVGVSDQHDISGLGAYSFSGTPFGLEDGNNWTLLAGNPVTLFASPSAGQPDLEYCIDNFSTLPGLMPDPVTGIFEVTVGLYSGSSGLDDGIGEDLLPGMFESVAIAIGLADLGVTKSVDNDRPDLSDHITFTIDVCNDGPTGASGVQVEDVLPSGVSFVNATPSQGSYDDATGIWDVGDLPAHQCATLTITVEIISVEDFENCAEVSASDVPDPDSMPGDGQGDDHDCVEVRPKKADLRLDKRADNPTPFGNEVTFTIEVCNDGPDVAEDIEVTDVLPAGLTVQNITPSQGSYDAGTGIWDIGDIPAGSCVTLVIEVTFMGSAPFENCAEVTGATTGDPDSSPNDGMGDDYDCITITPSVPMPDIQLEKTVYGGHDGGAMCPGGDLFAGSNGTQITYCFEVINTGNTHLDAVTLNDPDLGITRADMTLISGSEPLAPGASLVFYYDSTINGPLVNTADASGNPTDPGGNDLPGVNDPTDSDDAEVLEATTGIQIMKTVYQGHSAGAGCPGGELVVDINGANVTYCFEIMNTGSTHLDAITLNDPDLGITRANVTLLSGSEPLAPGAKISFYYETSIAGDLVNTAMTSGNPTDGMGNDLPGLNDPTDDDEAEVDEVAPAISLEKTVYDSQDAGASCPGGELVVGGLGLGITYCFEVTNTGDVHLDAITLNDADLGITRADVTLLSGSEPLAPGATLVFYYETNIAGDLLNTAMTSGNPTDSGGNDLPGLSDPMDDDTAEVQSPATGLELQKTVYAGQDNGAMCPGDDFVSAGPGFGLTYCFAVTNTGDTFLNDIAINDPDLGITEADMTVVSGSQPLAPGATIVFFYETNVNGDLVNTADASGNPTDSGGNDLPGFPDPSDDDDAEVDEALAGIQIQKTVYFGHDGGAGCPGVDVLPAPSGSNVTYCFEVLNTGMTHLDAITLTDNDLSITRADMTQISGSEPLAPGATLVFYYDTMMMGNLVNIAITSGNPTDAAGNDTPGLSDPVDANDAEVVEAAAGIEVQKTVYAGHDGGASCAGGELVQTGNGANVTYCFEVSNTGSTHLDAIMLLDADLGITRGDMTQVSGTEPLAPGASLVFYYETTASGDLVNSVAASGNPTDANGNDLDGFSDPMDDDTAEVDVVSPSLEIEKTVYVGHDNGNGCPGSQSISGMNGTEITYCFAVMNTGDTFLNDIAINDPALGITEVNMSVFSGSQPLAPGATIVFFYEATIQGDLVNTASASGNPTDSMGNDIPGADDPSDDDSAEVDEALAAINIEKTVYVGQDAGASCPGSNNVSGMVGSGITYCFEVSNTGMTHLNSIVINDPDLGITRADMTQLSGSEPLAPGASLVFYYETTITGDLVNTASASGNPTDAGGNDLPGFDDPNDEDSAEVDAAMAAIELSKTAYNGHNGGASCPGADVTSGTNGAPITYCFEVANTGMTHINDITINDADLGITEADMTVASGSQPLAPGASIVFFYETNISGSLVNTAEASGNPTDENGNDLPGFDNPSDDDTTEVQEQVDGDADLCVTKVVNDAMPMVGEQVTFTIFAINNGPNDASNVTVLDLLPNGLSYDSHAASKGSYDTNTGVWDIGTLANGESATLTITATVTESGSHQNCATIACPQDDPNPDNNHSCATVNTEGSSGGGGAGVESQASEEMAVLFARRLFSRTMAQDESIAKRDAIELPALEASTVNSHVDGAGHLASVISALVPEQLQAASATGLVSTPTDLLGYTNATAVFAADYVRSDSRRAAALFATSTPAGQLYDHAKVICDRFGGGIYDELSLVSVAGHPFILAKMIQPSGEVDYAIEFVAYQMGNQFEVEHRFSWGEYTPRGSGEVMNFQIWGAVPAYTIALAEEVLANLGQLGQVSYQAEAAELPSVFVRTARYNQGQLTLELANRAGVSQARISGSYTRIENGGAELPMDQTISLPAGQIAEVTLETGSIFSATLEVSTAQSDARDRLYQADGPWSYASDANSPISGFQVHPQSFVIEGDYVIERSARLAGRVAEGGWASLFRYLKPDQGAFDASAYRALVLEARGTGEVELVFGQKSLSEGQAYRTRVSLSGSYQEHVIDFSQLSRPSGVTGGFVGSDLELLAFYPVGTGVFDIEVRSLRLSYAVPVSVEDVELPRAIVLDQNYPNPFNPVTQIRFGLPESSQVKLTVYDVLGRAVRVLADGRLSAGYHVVEFGGLELASGTYIYRLETPTKTLTQKMTLLK